MKRNAEIVKQWNANCSDETSQVFKRYFISYSDAEKFIKVSTVALSFNITIYE